MLGAPVVYGGPAAAEMQQEMSHPSVGWSWRRRWGHQLWSKEMRLEERRMKRRAGLVSKKKWEREETNETWPKEMDHK